MCSPRNSYRVVMFGLENAGKTTIAQSFNKIKRKCVLRIAPNVQHFDWGPLRVTSIDVGPKCPNKLNTFNGSKAIVFVLDASDYVNFEEAKNQFWRVAKTPRMRKVPVLVMANKCDCPGALLPKQVEEKLCLPALNRKWQVIQTNARTGDGICEGFSWVKNRLSPPKMSCIAFLSELLIQLNSTDRQQEC